MRCDTHVMMIFDQSLPDELARMAASPEAGGSRSPSSPGLLPAAARIVCSAAPSSPLMTR